MRLIILCLLQSCSAHADFTGVDVFRIAHLEDIHSEPACANAIVTQIRQVKGCQSLPEVCKGNGQICLVLTTLGKYAAVCNATPNATYNYCE